MSISIKTKVYVGLLCLAAIFCLYQTTKVQYPFSISLLIFWSILAIVTESLGIELPNGAQVSVSFAICLAAIITSGPLVAAIVNASGFVFRILKLNDGSYCHLFNTALYKTLFNASQGIIISSISGLIYTSFPNTQGKFAILPTLIIIPIHIILNSIFVAQILSLLSGDKFISILTNSIKGTIPSTIAVSTLGIIISLAFDYGRGTTNNTPEGVVAVLIFFGPLLLARYSFKLYIDMRGVYIQTIEALSKSMEAKDTYTSGHASRVREYAVLLAKYMKLSEKQLQNIEKAALLHDIGKIGIDDNILRKPSGLTDEEYSQIKMHPVIGADILQNVNFLKEISEIIRCHHERYDGKGYPKALKGEDISMEAAILAIADVYDAMTSNRPYRNSLDTQTALNEIKRNAGVQFNPEVAKAFLEMMGYTEKSVGVSNV